jgi:hypothetical protein
MLWGKGTALGKEYNKGSRGEEEGVSRASVKGVHHGDDRRSRWPKLYLRWT